jgi:hypothetical protein
MHVGILAANYGSSKKYNLPVANTLSVFNSFITTNIGRNKLLYSLQFKLIVAILDEMLR